MEVPIKTTVTPIRLAKIKFENAKYCVSWEAVKILMGVYIDLTYSVSHLPLSNEDGARGFCPAVLCQSSNSENPLDVHKGQGKRFIAELSSTR